MDTNKTKYERLEELRFQSEERIKSIAEKEGFSFEHEKQVVHALQDTNYWRYRVDKLERKIMEKNQQENKTIYDIMAELVTHWFNEMMFYCNDYWSTYVGTLRAHKELIKLTNIMKEKIDELKLKDHTSSEDSKGIKKLLAKHQEYQEELVEDVDRLDKEDIESLRLLLSMVMMVYSFQVNNGRRYW